MKIILLYPVSSKFIRCFSTSIFYTVRCNNDANFSTFVSFNNKTNIKSVKEKALEYVSQSTRLKLQDLKDNPGARTMVCKLIYF